MTYSVNELLSSVLRYKSHGVSKSLKSNRLGGKKMKKLLFVLVIVSSLISACGAAEATSTPELTNTPVPPTAPPSTPTPQFLQDISYMPDQDLDVYLPEGVDKPFPILLALHGDAGAKKDLMLLAKYLRERGYAVVAADWGVSMDGVNRSVVSHAFCALAWIHTNAETYGIDPQRVVVFGFSSGGHLAALLGSVDETTEFMEGCPHQLPASDWTKAGVTYGGVFGTPKLGLSLFLQIYRGAIQLPHDEQAEIHQTLMDTPLQSWREISGFSEKGTKFLHSLPPYWVDGSEPPFLLIHGEGDTLVGSAEPEAFVAQLQAVGVDAKLLILSNAFHNDIRNSKSSGFEDACQAIEAFLTEVLE
jgi:acetyl esterase/lipase